MYSGGALERITSKLIKLLNIYLWLPKELHVSIILKLGNLKIKCYRENEDVNDSPTQTAQLRRIQAVMMCQ